MTPSMLIMASYGRIVVLSIIFKYIYNSLLFILTKVQATVTPTTHPIPSLAGDVDVNSRSPILLVAKSVHYVFNDHVYSHTM